MWRDLALHQAKADGRLGLAEDYLDRWDADFEPWIQSDSHLIGVAQGGVDASNIVGFVHARRTEPPPIFAYLPEVFIEGLWVDEVARKHGVARGLVDLVLSWASEAGVARVRYSVLDTDPVAVAFWREVGGVPLLTYGTLEVPEASGEKVEALRADAGRRQIGFAAERS